jgi:ABC-type multidrug transport system fused ATPase/permease subunit
MNADLILYLEDGRIVESGTHAELLRANGRYAAMYGLQGGNRNAEIEAQVPALSSQP